MCFLEFFSLGKHSNFSEKNRIILQILDEIHSKILSKIIRVIVHAAKLRIPKMP